MQILAGHALAGTLATPNLIERRPDGTVTVVSLSTGGTRFRARLNDGTWEEFDETLPYTITAINAEAVTFDDEVDLQAIGTEFTLGPLTAPTYTVSLGAISAGQSVGVPGSGADVMPTLGGADGVPAGTYTWSATVDAAPASLPIAAVAGTDIVMTIADPDHPTGAFSASSAPVTVSAAAQISATLTPTMSPLYEGQAIDDTTDYATMVSAGNFTSNVPGETIDTVDVTATDDAASVSDALDEGDVAGFIVDVTGSEDTLAEFVADPIAVDYKVRVTIQPNDTLEIDINPLVPTSEVVDIEVTEPTVYAGVYELTRDDLATGPVNGAPPVISGTLGEGNTLNSIPGLWFSDDDESIVAFTPQWRRSGVDISGATSADYTQVAADVGEVMSLAVTATDTNGNRTAISNELSAAVTFSAAEVGRHIVDAGGASSSARTLSGVALGNDATKDVYLLVGTQSGNNSHDLGHSAVTIGGVVASQVATVGTSNSIDFAHMETWRATVPAATGDIILTPRTSYRLLTVQVIEVVGADVAAEATVTAYGVTSATNLSMNLTTGDIFLGAIIRDATAGEDTSFVGATKTGSKLEEASHPGKYAAYCRHVAEADETPRTITANHSGTATAVAGVGVRLRAA